MRKVRSPSASRANPSASAETTVRVSSASRSSSAALAAWAASCSAASRSAVIWVSRNTARESTTSPSSSLRRNRSKSMSWNPPASFTVRRPMRRMSRRVPIVITAEMVPTSSRVAAANRLSSTTLRWVAA